MSALIRVEPGTLSDGRGAYVHLASADDTSAAHRTYPIGYDSDCAWCWLNAPHTDDAHACKVAERVEADRVWAEQRAAMTAV